MACIAAPSPPEVRSRRAYLALVWSLSYPGRTYALPEPAAGDDELALVADTLLDLETSTFTPDDMLARRLATTGARAAPVGSAAYVFLPHVDDAALELIGEVNLGTYVYPDAAATVICGCELDAPGAAAVQLSGPGVAGSITLRLGGIPGSFWDLRARLIHYPLGFDIFFVGGGRIAGLPRTTVVS